MRIFLLGVLVLTVSCIVSPEFERSNEFDLSAGIPYIHNYQYNFTQNGLLIGWLDGSLDNEEYILTFKKFSASDSSITNITLPGDSNFYIDQTNEYGLPYSIIITSNIYGKNEVIKEQRKDTLSVSYGSISVNYFDISNGFLETRINVRNFTPAIHSIVLDVNRNGTWERFSEIAPNQNTFQFPEDELDEIISFKYGITINDYNSRKILADSVIYNNTFN